MIYKIFSICIRVVCKQTNLYVNREPHVDGLSADSLVAPWNVELTKAINCLAPKRPLRLRGAQTAPWFSPGLRAMKQSLRRLKRRWKKTHSESYWTQVRAQCRAYQVAVVMVEEDPLHRLYCICRKQQQETLSGGLQSIRTTVIGAW